MTVNKCFETLALETLYFLMQLRSLLLAGSVAMTHLQQCIAQDILVVYITTIFNQNCSYSNAIN